VEAVANLTLWASDRTFVLPADGTPSMLFRFGRLPGVTFGARAVDPAGVPFAAGTEHTGVQLHFWAEEVARSVIVIGGLFDVWYGEDIGSGRITAVS